MGIIHPKHILACTAFLACCLTLSAQRKVSADIEIKQVTKGKVVTVTKSVCCTSDGRFVTRFRTPEDYYVVSNPKGETRIYIPRTNEVIQDLGTSQSAKDELIWIFLTGKVDDLGVMQYGYRPASTTRDGQYVKKTFVSSEEGNIPTVEVVLENFLPIYCAYIDKSSRAVSKTYLSNYFREGRFVLPARTTSISYMDGGKDSTVVRTIYSNIRVDADDPLLDFVIPSDAKSVSNPLQGKKK